MRNEKNSLQLDSFSIKSFPSFSISKSSSSVFSISTGNFSISSWQIWSFHPSWRMLSKYQTFKHEKITFKRNYPIRISHHIHIWLFKSNKKFKIFQIVLHQFVLATLKLTSSTTFKTFSSHENHSFVFFGLNFQLFNLRQMRASQDSRRDMENWWKTFPRSKKPTNLHRQSSLGKSAQVELEVSGSRKQF